MNDQTTEQNIFAASPECSDFHLNGGDKGAACVAAGVVCSRGGLVVVAHFAISWRHGGYDQEARRPFHASDRAPLSDRGPGRAQNRASCAQYGGGIATVILDAGVLRLEAAGVNVPVARLFAE